MQPAEPEEKGETPVIPVQPAEPEEKEEIPAIPVQPAVPEEKEETPAIPVQPAEPEEKEEIPAVPVQPAVPEEKEETPAVPVQPAGTQTTPAVPAIPEDKSIVISTKGERMTNSEILLYAKNADGTGTNYQNAVWSIVKDDGTESVIEKNVLIAKNVGTVVVKVTIGHGIPRIRTKVIEIAQ